MTRRKNEPGRPCCGCPPNNFEVRLRGCDSAKVIGGTVTMDGTTVAVDSNSNATFTVAPGTYTITGTGPGYTGGSTSVTINVDCTPGQATLTLTPDANHVCCPCCTDKIARKVLYLTDANGTWTLTSIGGCDWRGTATVTKKTAVLSWISCSSGTLPPYTCYRERVDCDGSGSVEYVYRLTCTSGQWNLTVFAPTVSGQKAGTGCVRSPADDTYCYGDYALLTSPIPGTICPGAALDVAGGGMFAQILTMTVDTACAMETLALSGTLGAWDVGAPSDGPVVTGTITVSA